MTTAATEVKERPVIFSGPMVRAIIEGRKTETRRVIRPQPTGPGYTMLTPARNFITIWPDDDGFDHFAKCPYGKPGDRLWLKENFRLMKCEDPFPAGELSTNIIFYPANLMDAEPDDIFGRLRVARFMPRWASRITLEVVNVRVEQIKQISLEDIEAEGTPEGLAQSQWNDGYARHQDFRVLWDSINKSRGFGWDTNPWVFVISFRRIDNA